VVDQNGITDQSLITHGSQCGTVDPESVPSALYAQIKLGIFAQTEPVGEGDKKRGLVFDKSGIVDHIKAQPSPFTPQRGWPVFGGPDLHLAIGFCN
jgi:hypothetical protein